ncbi:MAG: beta-galactosidase [Lachnotalea sp.]
MNVNNLFYGAAYYAEYMPYDRIETDMQLLKKAGMNVIRIAESTWSTWEPQDNIFDFSYLHYMLNAALKYDIKIIIGTPTYAIPAWLAKKYPDILVTTHQGQSLYGHRQNMDLTHPEYLKHAERMIRRLLKECANHKQIIGFQLDNETKSYDTCSIIVQSQFVDYLKETFQTTEILNQTFGLTYWSNRINNWEDFTDIRGTINASLAAEFEKFQRSLVVRFLSWQSDIVKEYKRTDQFITQNFDFEWRNYSFGLQPEVNQPDVAKALTVAGVDIYHPSAGELTGAEIAMGGTIGRSIKKDNYLVLETQAQGNPGWLPYPGQLRLQAYSHLANGANAVLYWHWHSIHHSYESYWKGVLSHDLSENNTYLEACRIGAEWKEHDSLLKNLKKNCQVALMLSNEALTGIKYFSISENLKYNDVVRWIFDALYRINIECDIIYPNELHLEQYSLIVLPALYSMSEETSQRLDTYIHNGGHLLATFKSGFADEYLGIYHDAQPHKLTNCFGITYNQFTLPTEKTKLASKHFEISNDCTISEWMELVQKTDDTTEILANYDHTCWSQYAAITHHTYGAGSAAYIGCYFSSRTLEQILEILCKKMNITTSSYHFPLIIKEGINDNGNTIRYLFNYSNKPVSYLFTENDAYHILKSKKISHSETINLDPWDVVILQII